MIVGTRVVTFFAANVHSLKEKRNIVKSLIARLRRRFNISVAEIDTMDKWQIITLGMACTSSSAEVCERELNAAVAYAEQNGEAEITDILHNDR